MTTSTETATIVFTNAREAIQAYAKHGMLSLTNYHTPEHGLHYRVAVKDESAARALQSLIVADYPDLVPEALLDHSVRAVITAAAKAQTPNEDHQINHIPKDNIVKAHEQSLAMDPEPFWVVEIPQPIADACGLVLRTDPKGDIKRHPREALAELVAQSQKTQERLAATSIGLQSFEAKLNTTPPSRNGLTP